MINRHNLKFGDIVYQVEEKNNAFIKKKLKTVIDGVEWFRYDRDHWEYSINELVYCGRTSMIIEGEVTDDRYESELHFKYPDDKIYGEYENTIETIEDWFHTRKEAEEYIKVLKAKRAE